MPKKVRSESCSGGWCKNHLLQISPLNNVECYYRRKTKLRFCPKHDTTNQTFKNTLPVVNGDRRHYTPCFILQEEEVYYKDNDQRLRGNHDLRLEPSEKATIMVAKHGRMKNYCSVCRTDYEDYLEHIEDSYHRGNLRGNRFSKLILEMGQEMAQAGRPRAEMEMPLDSIAKLPEETKDGVCE